MGGGFPAIFSQNRKVGIFLPLFSYFCTLVFIEDDESGIPEGESDMALVLAGSDWLTETCKMLYINDHIETLDWEARLSELPKVRQEKCLDFKHDTGRRQCVAVWLLLREALRTEFGLADAPEVAVAEHGKPYFPSRPDIFFSLSHCATGVACAVGTRPVGVDIERIRPFNEMLAAYVLNEEELDTVRRAADPALTFTILWTRKECLLKLTGEGLRHDLKGLLVGCRHSFQTVVGGESRYVCSWVEA